MMLVYLLACGGTGALAAHWLPAPRDAGTAAGRGALAGGLAGLIGGAVNAVAMMIQSSTLDYAEVISQLPTETLDALKQIGITPDMLESSGGTIGGLLERRLLLRGRCDRRPHPGGHWRRDLGGGTAQRLAEEGGPLPAPNKCNSRYSTEQIQ